MKICLQTLIIYVIIGLGVAMAYPPLPTDDLMASRKFDNIVSIRATIETGLASKVITLPKFGGQGLDTGSAVTASVNTNCSNYIRNVVRGNGTVEVVLNAGAVQTLEISIIGLRR